MFNHEHYRVLSATAMIGQLSADEYRELSEHLRGCPSCRHVLGEYSYLVDTHLPRVNHVRWRVEANLVDPDPELCNRFLARARAVGIDLSNESVQPGPRFLFASPWWRWKWQFAVTVLAMLGLCGTWAMRRYQIVSRSSSEIADMATGATELNRKKITGSDSEAAIQGLQMQLSESRRRVAALLSQLKQAKSAGAQSANDDKEKENLVAELRAQNDMLSRQIAANLNDSTVRESRMEGIAASFERKTEDLEREHQLTAASNDVRQLMTARNLHVIDVREVEGGSKAANSFGRIFYSEGQFLIFYAFDLPDGKISQNKYTFQVWAETGLQSRKLGTFRVDAREQSRWVLKVDDPALLAGVYSVFVTADSQIDAPEPSGRKLLYAYIPGQLNRP